MIVAKEAPAASLALRRAGPEDREALVAMYLAFEPKGACFGLPPRGEPQVWLDSLSASPNFVVTHLDRVVGHAVLCGDGSAGEVAVFVHQDFRGHGLGKMLLNELVAEARRRGLRRVWGMTELDNIPMLRLARSLGFVSGRDPREFYLDLATAARPSATAA
jgi:GNAT superfamily N-acetyltransferase